MKRKTLVGIAIIAIVAVAMFSGCVEEEQVPPVEEGEAPPTEKPTVPAPEEGRVYWTFMVYMDGDNNLEGSAITDLNEMEIAGSTSNVNIVVQLDRVPDHDDSNGDWTGTKRFYVTKDDDWQMINSDEVQDLGEVNMGDPDTLVDFVEWAATSYPAEHYALVIWDHGGGWQSVANDDTDDKAGITMPELKTALSTIQSKTGIKFDLIGFDTCLMGQLEVDHLIAPYADIRVASEELEPGAGWDYEPTLIALTSNPTMSAEQLAKQIIDDFKNYYAAVQKDETITLSAVDLSQIDEVVSAVDDLAQKMNMDIDKAWPEIGHSRAYTETYSKDEKSYGYIDLVDFAKILKQKTTDTPVKSAAERVIGAVNKAVIYEAHGKDHPHSHGTTIYFVEDDALYNKNYEASVDFAEETAWDEFLTRYYGGENTDTVAPEVIIGGISSDVASAENPVDIDATISGNNIVDVYMMVGLIEDDHFIIMDFDTVEVEPYVLEDGSTLPGWIDGDNPITFTWDTTGGVISDGITYIHAPMEPIERNSNLYSVEGIYTDSITGESFDASLIFDVETGGLEYVWAYLDYEGTTAPMEVIPKVGDTFMVYQLVFTSEEEEPEVYDGGTLTFSEQGLTTDLMPLPDGEYGIGFIVEDLSGNYAEDYVAIAVQNA